MGDKLETVRFPVSVYDYLKAERDAFNKTRRAGQKLSLANYLRLKYDELKALKENASMAQAAPLVAEKTVQADETPVNMPEEKQEVEEMSESCPHCTAKDIEISRIKTELLPEKEGKIKSLTDQIADLTRQLAEKPKEIQIPAAHEIPEDLGEVIEHCTSGKCPEHAAQWNRIVAGIVESNKPGIVQATLENLPDTVVESEGLKRGFIPKKIIIPVKSR